MKLLRRIVLTAVLAGAIAFAAGFWLFTEDVRAPAPNPAPDADAVVALTGGSVERLKTGVRLLKEAHAGKLLISGVNRDVADAELTALLDIEADLAACCVEFGRSAEDTLGNASETAAWADRNNLKSLILVTDDYHMPRSYAELSIAMPNVAIYRYPVRTRWTNPKIWRNDLAAANRLLREYVKYLMIRGREALIAMSDEHPAPVEGAVPAP